MNSETADTYSETGIADAMKAELWRRFGHPDYSSEWDGRVYGGGKLSQRFWEYFKTIEFLNLNAQSKVLDLGGGSPATGAGFFAKFLAAFVQEVVILDPSLDDHGGEQNNLVFIKKPASKDSLREIFKNHSDITHISCVSVFEHIDGLARKEIAKTINDFFPGNVFVTTLEYHSQAKYFEHQLTAKSLSALVAPFERFYLDQFEASPVLCENAFEEAAVAKWKQGRRWFAGMPYLDKIMTPRWYPIALRFVRLR